MSMQEQWHTEASLTEYLKSKHGFTVTRGMTVTDFQQVNNNGGGGGGSVVVTTVCGKRYTSRYLVGTDGARSTIRKLLGVDFQGETLDKGFLTIVRRRKIV